MNSVVVLRFDNDILLKILQSIQLLTPSQMILLIKIATKTKYDSELFLYRSLESWLPGLLRIVLRARA